MGEAVVLVVFTIIVLTVLFFSFSAVKFYIDPRFNDYLATIVASISTALTLTTVFLIPIDVYLAQTKRFNLAVDSVLGMYYFVFSLLLLLLFVVLPFVYFYYETPSDLTSSARVRKASKNTLVSAILLVTIFLIGVLVEAFRFHGVTDAAGILLLFENKHFMASTMEVCMGILFLSGNLGVMVYCAFGLSAMPILEFLKRCGDNIPYLDDPHFKGRNEINFARSVNSANRKKLWRKYRLTGRKMSRDQRMKYEEFNERERLLKKREAKLVPLKTKPYLCRLIQRHGWTKFCIGVILLLGSWNIVLSITITIVDRFGQCESYLECSTGYLMKERNMESPMDWFLLFVSRFFPLDYVILGIIVLYFLISAVHAMTSLGVRFLFFFSVYPLRERKTYPQGIILAAANLIFIAFAITFQMAYIAPQYSSFGLQEYKSPEGTMQPCSLIMSAKSYAAGASQAKKFPVVNDKGSRGNNNNLSEKPAMGPLLFQLASHTHKHHLKFRQKPKHINNTTGATQRTDGMIQCQPSQLSMIIHGLMAKYGFFGSMFQYIEIGFVTLFLIFSVISIGRNPRKRWISTDDLSDDDDVDEEIADAYFDDEDSDDYSVE